MRRYAAKLSTIFPALLMASAAEAYIGPGAGLSAIGSVLALIGAVLLMIVGFVWYPVKRLMRRKKETAAAARSGDARDQDREADEPQGSKANRESQTDEGNGSKANREPDSPRAGSSP